MPRMRFHDDAYLDRRRRKYDRRQTIGTGVLLFIFCAVPAMAILLGAWSLLILAGLFAAWCAWEQRRF